MTTSSIASLNMPYDAIEELGQLFLRGPTWDGNLCSKVGRTWLVKNGLAERGLGWNWLTRRGVELAATCDAPWPEWRKKAAMT